MEELEKITLTKDFELFLSKIEFNSFNLHVESDQYDGLLRVSFCWVTQGNKADLVVVHPGETFIYNKCNKSEWRIERDEG